MCSSTRRRSATPYIYNEFFNVNEVAKAKTLLAHGEERAKQLTEGQAPWTAATGLVVRGYISRIDKSVQPYGLVVPASYFPNSAHKSAWTPGSMGAPRI